MENQANLGGVFTMPGTSLTLNRIGYGAMQLPGPQVWGPPKDRYAALALLKEAIALGINHVDTADYYGPNVSNELIREALYPYPDNLVIVTKVGYGRGPDRSWQPALSAADLERAVHANLTVLRLDAIDIVNLRLGGDGGPREGSIKAPLEVLVGLVKKGLIRHIGLSNVTPRQFAEAESITEIVCVQNYYNVAHREDDDFIDILAGKGIAYIPFFPLGGFTPLQSTVLDEAARVLKATPMQVALAWLLQRAPNILLIPGTSSVKHLRENLGAATVELPREVRMKIDTIAVVHRSH
jgi:aryl-alcohol dehydrogenase-like predicted oxidoreductase